MSHKSISLCLKKPLPVLVHVTLHRQLVSSADRLGAGRFVKVDRIPSSTQLPIFCVTSIMLEAVECVFSECISIPKSYLGVLESKS